MEAITISTACATFSRSKSKPLKSLEDTTGVDADLTIRIISAVRAYCFFFKCASFAAMKARISADMSSSFSHCSLYKVTGKRPIP